MQKHTKIHGFSKLKLIIILALMSSIAPLSTDMYLPALSHIEQGFHTSKALAQLSLASFFVAFTLGQLIYGLLSDIFGRKIPVLIGVFLFIALSLLCVIADDIYAFAALRFFEALGGCAGVVIARAIVNDLFEIKEAAGIFVLMMVFSSLAPMLSPVFGSFLLECFSWHSIFTTLFALGILLFLMILFSLKESAPHLKNKKFSHKEAMKSYKFVLKDKRFLTYVFCAALALTAMFAYITGSSFVFTESFDLSEQQFGMLFGANALGFVICANINARLVRKSEDEKVFSKALMIMSVSALILLINAFLYPNLFLFEANIFTSTTMLGFIAPNTTTLAMARFKEHSGTASAVPGFIQFALAGLISSVASALDVSTPMIPACVMCACVLVANMIYFLGKKNPKGKI